MKNVRYINQHSDAAIKACQYTEQTIIAKGEPEHFFQLAAFRNSEGELEIELSWAGESNIFSKVGLLEYIKQRINE